MCGIVGLFGKNLDRLPHANSCLAHRGPDDDGVFIDRDAGISLGQRRLSILDLSPLGHQPMISDDGRIVLVYNGEIYNFRELRTNLEDQGVSFKGNSDTEVLLNLYMTKGEGMLPLLNGIFAFAIWDSRSQELFIARDGLGVKPLYYSAEGEGFVFASEIKALLHLIPKEKALDIQAIHRYLTFLWCPGEGTPLKSVRKLLPGEAMVVQSGRVQKKWIWYELPFFRGIPEELNQSQSINGTTNHLRQAVHRQLISDVPLGAFLSGGLDSSAVVAFAREKNPDIRCFTIETTGGQEVGMADDLPYARRVAKHLDVPLDVVTIDSSRMASDLERMVAQLDEPLADPAPLNVLYISQLAREKGIKVLLSGAGGDDLFTGYRRHRAVQLERLWNWLPYGIRAGMGRVTQGLDARKPLRRRLAKLFNGAHLEGDARLVNYFRWVDPSLLQQLYSENFQAELGGTDASEPLLEFLRPLSSDVSPLNRMLALEQRYFLSDHNLIYTDRMSMASGVEVRVPFLDLDLVDFAAGIPVKYKQRGSEGKWVLKKAMEPYLPHDVIYRSKTGFGAPLRCWMQHDLRELLGDLLSSESLSRRGLFSPKGVHQLIADNDSGKIDASYILLSLLCIELWCRVNID